MPPEHRSAGALAPDVIKRARFLRGPRAYLVRTCRRILKPGNEQNSPPVRALRRLFGNYLEVTADGHPFIVDLRDAVVSYGIVADGAWEEEETALIRRLLRPGDRVVDVGGHIGYHAVIFAAAVGPSGKVLTFEPAGDNADLLQINVTLNGYGDVVELARAAAGSEEALVELVLDETNRGAHYVRPASSPDVRCVRLATVDAATAAWARVDAVKIDVEGHEWHVLQGMRQTLARNSDLAIFVEFWPAALRRAGADPATFVRELEGQAFGMWEIRRPGGLVRFDREAVLARLSGPKDLVDLVCLRGPRFAGFTPE